MYYKGKPCSEEERVQKRKSKEQQVYYKVALKSWARHFIPLDFHLKMSKGHVLPDKKFNVVFFNWPYLLFLLDTLLPPHPPHPPLDQ